MSPLKKRLKRSLVKRGGKASRAAEVKGPVLWVNESMKVNR